MKTTTKQYVKFEKIFDYLNHTLFNDSLPDCMLRFTRRSNQTNGYFLPSSWSGGGNVKHEISLNPLLLEKRDKKEILSVICHNMVHLWQHIHCETTDFSRRYHDKKWSEKMESIGLIPSQTGKKGGKKVGKSISQYIQPGGLFERACKKMPDEYLIPFRAINQQTNNKSNKTKISYTCPTCKTTSWGKPGLRFICEPCARQALENGILNDIPEGAREQIAEFLDWHIFREKQPRAKPKGVA